jgi:hypothetical protein
MARTQPPKDLLSRFADLGEEAMTGGARRYYKAGDPEEAAGLTVAQLRCFLTWPPGHRWELQHEGRYHFKRCRECGKATAVRSDAERPPPPPPMDS